MYLCHIAWKNSSAKNHSHAHMQTCHERSTIEGSSGLFLEVGHSNWVNICERNGGWLMLELWHSGGSIKSGSRCQLGSAKGFVTTGLLVIRIVAIQNTKSHRLLSLYKHRQNNNISHPFAVRHSVDEIKLHGHGSDGTTRRSPSLSASRRTPSAWRCIQGSRPRCELGQPPRSRTNRIVAANRDTNLDHEFGDWITRWWVLGAVAMLNDATAMSGSVGIDNSTCYLSGKR